MPFSGSTVVFGCGNILLGDDGYGPAVIARLEAARSLPPEVSAVDAGTGIREYLFDYLLCPELRPARIIILDAVDFSDRRAGELFIIHPTELPGNKIHDFSLHQFPTVNLLSELAEETGMKVVILAAQVSSLPDRVAPGLSPAMQKAVLNAAQRIRELTARRSTAENAGIPDEA